MQIDMETLKACIPAKVAEAVKNNELYKLGEARVGGELTFYKIAQHIGTQLALRKAKSRDIQAGLASYNALLSK
jgi:hypothetical protein